MYSNHRNGELHETIEPVMLMYGITVSRFKSRYYAIYGKYISKFRLIQRISKLKRLPKFAHWNLLPSQSIQDVVTRLDKGYRAMFEACATWQEMGSIPVSSPDVTVKSFTLLQAGWELSTGQSYQNRKTDIFRFQVP